MTEPHSPRRFWLGGKRAAEQDRFFREALEPLGWQVGDEHDWDAAWITGMPEAGQFRRVSPTRTMNHFPGNAALTVKSRLHESLSTLRERIHESHGPEHELARRLAFFPRAYVMPGDYHALQQAAQDHPEQRWILKPTNASKGKGIRLLKDVGEAPLARDWLVQEYLANPHTIRGHKYVLRLYVLISSLAPLRVYLYRQGFAKLASEPWDPDDADNPYSQLTNPDINALNDRAEVPVEFIDFDRYRQWLKDQGHDDDALFARIEDLVALTAISAVDAMRARTAEVGADPRGCYELLGLDCLVDDTLKPWILECNLSPSLGICAAPESGGRVEEAVKGGLVRDLVTLIDIPGRAVRKASNETASEEEDQAPGAAAALVAEAEAERARAGGFRRLLPAADPECYLPYFTLPSLADRRLAEGLVGRSLPAPRLARRHVVEIVDEERLALYDTRRGDLYRPNDTAALIWLLATEGLDLDAIVEALASAANGATDERVTDHESLRREVWSTLHDWCRAGLLCQRGAAGVSDPGAGAAAAASETPPVERLFALGLAGQEWALSVASAPAVARLASGFGERLTPLADEAASRLPRLRVLRETAGYALADADRLLASRLTLAQLAPALTTHLLRRVASPDRPVIDAPLLVMPDDTAVLCLLPEGEPRRRLLTRLREAGDGRLTRGVRLELSDPTRAEPLDLPLADAADEPASSRPASRMPAGVTLRGVLLPGGEHVQEPLAPVAMLEALGALLPHCLAGEGQMLEGHGVTALGDWLSTLALSAIPTDSGSETEAIQTGSEAQGPSSASLAAWLATHIAPEAPVASSAAAVE
ncbi:PqqD family peptide modification chaperone [Halomonas saccharevitans]|uniref:PqqD family peptide modification chaperone n=1 Tax=Halomonas saccharevitans TaxID=416872 RepID=A0ABU3NEN5_9GAMM|nr:PqqD family peptide modification chaperone [Halomonas saccharevitans]MDT8879649.1 PqqD family peptide modification chaperone [Halomonas saccharevitans]